MGCDKDGMKRLIFPFALCLPAPALAAERGYSVTDFDRIRVDGPYRVTVTNGRSPSVRAVGSAAAIDAVKIEVQGRTLLIRRSVSSWGGYPGRAEGAVELKVTAHGLRAASLAGSGSLEIDRMRAPSVDLALIGAGSLRVAAVETDRLRLSASGSGAAAVAGKAAIADYSLSGTAGLDASKLLGRDVKLFSSGPGNATAFAERTVAVTASGSGAVTILGKAACTVKATGSGTVACGD